MSTTVGRMLLPQGSLHIFADALHRHAVRAEPWGKIIPVKWFNLAG